MGLGRQEPNGAYCKALERKINNIRKQLNDRYNDLDNDKLNLPERIGPGESLYQTRRGHRTIINQLQRSLKRAEDRYIEDCTCYRKHGDFKGSTPFILPPNVRKGGGTKSPFLRHDPFLNLLH